MNILHQDFYNRDPITVAKNLLGKVLTRKLGKNIISGRIVETESYLGMVDEAAHSFIGKTNRNKSLFGEAGYAYVHSIHMQNCIDIVTEGEGKPTSVLIRALEPLEGKEVMKLNRNKIKLLDLTTGPGKLTKALNINKTHDGLNLTNSSSEIFIIDDGYKVDEKDIISSKRIGITKSADLKYRFSIKDNLFVSKKIKI